MGTDVIMGYGGKSTRLTWGRLMGVVYRPFRANFGPQLVAQGRHSLSLRAEMDQKLHRIKALTFCPKKPHLDESLPRVQHLSLN